MEEGDACRMRDTKEKRKKIVLLWVYKVKKKINGGMNERKKEDIFKSLKNINCDRE